MSWDRNQFSDWEQLLLIELYQQVKHNWFTMHEWQPGPFVDRDAMLLKLYDMGVVSRYQDKYKFKERIEKCN